MCGHVYGHVHRWVERIAATTATTVARVATAPLRELIEADGPACVDWLFIDAAHGDEDAVLDGSDLGRLNSSVLFFGHVPPSPYVKCSAAASVAASAVQQPLQSVQCSSQCSNQCSAAASAAASVAACAAASAAVSAAACA